MIRVPGKKEQDTVKFYHVIQNSMQFQIHPFLYIYLFGRGHMAQGMYGSPRD